MSTITLQLPQSTVRKLQSHASESGQTVERFLESLAEHVAQRDSMRSSWDDLLEPLRQGFRDSGLTDESLAEFIEQERSDQWRERHAAGVKSL